MKSLIGLAVLFFCAQVGAIEWCDFSMLEKRAFCESLFLSGHAGQASMYGCPGPQHLNICPERLVRGYEFCDEAEYGCYMTEMIDILRQQLDVKIQESHSSPYIHFEDFRGNVAYVKKPIGQPAEVKFHQISPTRYRVCLVISHAN